MQSDNLIAVDVFCAHHNIEISFISSLQQTGLIEITTIKDAGFLNHAQLQQIEKFLCYYYELDINMEGIEAITHMLERINTMQHEIISLKNRLHLYESSE